MKFEDLKNEEQADLLNLTNDRMADAFHRTMDNWGIEEDRVFTASFLLSMAFKYAFYRGYSESSVHDLISSAWEQMKKYDDNRDCQAHKERSQIRKSGKDG